MPRDQTSDLRVSCGTPRARSGERYYRKRKGNVSSGIGASLCDQLAERFRTNLRRAVGQFANKSILGRRVVSLREAEVDEDGDIFRREKDIGGSVGENILEFDIAMSRRLT